MGVIKENIKLNPILPFNCCQYLSILDLCIMCSSGIYVWNTVLRRNSWPPGELTGELGLPIRGGLLVSSLYLDHPVGCRHLQLVRPAQIFPLSVSSRRKMSPDWDPPSATLVKVDRQLPRWRSGCEIKPKYIRIKIVTYSSVKNVKTEKRFAQ